MKQSTGRRLGIILVIVAIALVGYRIIRDIAPLDAHREPVVPTVRITASASLKITIGEREPIGQPQRSPRGLTFSPDGTLLAWAGQDIQVWNVGAKSEKMRVPVHESFDVVSLNFSADSRMLAATRLDAGVKSFHVNTGGVVCEIPGDANLPLKIARSGAYSIGVTNASFSPDLRVLAVMGGAGDVKLCDGVSGKVLHTLKHAMPVRAFAFSPDNKILVTGTDHKVEEIEAHNKRVIGPGEVKLWEWPIGKDRGVLPVPQLDRVEVLTFSPDGKGLAIVSLRHLWVWNTVENKGRFVIPLQTQPAADEMRDMKIHTLSFSADGRWLAGLGTDMDLLIAAQRS